MTVIEAIDELAEKFSSLDRDGTLTVEQGRLLLLQIRRCALWCDSISKRVIELEHFTGAPLP